MLSLPANPPLGRWAPLPLRLIVGYGFVVHGYAKLARGPDTFAAVLHTLGVPAPHLLAWMTTLVELTGGGTKFGPVGYEHVLLYLAGLAALVLGGAGAFSIDGWRAARVRSAGPARLSALNPT